MNSTKKRPARRPNPEALGALMEEWPASWAGLDEDIDPGRRLLAKLRPFIMHLIEEGFSAKTVRCHLGNLWAIGGEVVRRFNDEPELRHESAHQLLLDAVEIEAPLLRHATEAEQRSTDATARKLHKFLLATESIPPS